MTQSALSTVSGWVAWLGSLLKLRHVQRGWRIKSGHSAEVNQKKRHLPLRPLFGRVPNRLVRLKPCWMMSPLAVSTDLESPEFQFDVVIFDECWVALLDLTVLGHGLRIPISRLVVSH
jgi:hypothetical protein